MKRLEFTTRNFCIVNALIAACFGRKSRRSSILLKGDVRGMDLRAFFVVLARSGLMKKRERVWCGWEDDEVSLNRCYKFYYSLCGFTIDGTAEFLGENYSVLM